MCIRDRVNSNADGFHTELTEFNLSQNYNIIGLFEENKKLKNELNNISKSKEYKLGLFIISPLKKIKRFLLK